MDSDELHLAAAALDPKMKMRWCRFSDTVELEQKVRSVMLSMMEKIGRKTEFLQQASKKKTGDLFDFLATSEPKSSKVCHSAKVELELYLDSEEDAPSVLAFWRDNAKVFPRLAMIVKQIMCAPASTAAVERLFSIAGYILSSHRTKN